MTDLRGVLHHSNCNTCVQVYVSYINIRLPCRKTIIFSWFLQSYTSIKMLLYAALLKTASTVLTEVLLVFNALSNGKNRERLFFKEFIIRV